MWILVKDHIGSIGIPNFRLQFWIWKSNVLKSYVCQRALKLISVEIVFKMIVIRGVINPHVSPT